MITSLICFSLGVFCYGIKELQSHGKLKWQKGDDSFWGEQSWKRKWKPRNSENFQLKEAFLGSSTIFVFVTDSYHLMQFFFIKLFVASIILYSPLFSWWVDGLVYLGVWYLTFWAVYNGLQKKTK